MSCLGDCDVPLPEAVVFVCVYVTMCQLCSELCIYGGGSHLDSAKCHDTRLRLLVANLAIYSIWSCPVP